MMRSAPQRLAPASSPRRRYSSRAPRPDCPPSPRGSRCPHRRRSRECRRVRMPRSRWRCAQRQIARHLDGAEDPDIAVAISVKVWSNFSNCRFPRGSSVPRSFSDHYAGAAAARIVQHDVAGRVRLSEPPVWPPLTWPLVMAEFRVTSPAVAIRLMLVPARLARAPRSIVWLGATSENSGGRADTGNIGAVDALVLDIALRVGRRIDRAREPRLQRDRPMLLPSWRYCSAVRSRRPGCRC